MGDWMYYGVLAVVLFIAVYFFRRGHIILSLLVLAVGGWVIYSKEKDLSLGDVKENLYESIDEAAKSEYKKKGISSPSDEYNTSTIP